MNLFRRNKLFLAAIAAAIGSHPALASAGCFSSVCTGVLLKDLQVSWMSKQEQAAQEQRMLRSVGSSAEDHRASARRVFPGMSDSDIANVAKYTGAYGGWFLDDSVAGAFSRASPICSFDSVVGSFRSESGHGTKVTFRPKIGADGGSAFAVALIERQYAGIHPDSPEGKALLDLMRKKFGEVCDHIDARMSGCDGATYSDDPGGIVFELFDPELHVIVGQMDFSMEQADRLANLDGCESKISVD